MTTNFALTRSFFHLPEGIVYLDGNSLGPLPKGAQARLDRVLEREWGEMLINAWNDAGWMDYSVGIGNRIGRLIGAAEGSIVVGDTLSIKLYQALAAALDLNPKRRVILSDTGNFPSDLYMAEGLIRASNKNLELKVVDPQQVADAIDDSVAVVMLTEVDYRTGRRHAMTALTERAHDAGAITVWDLAHSAGAIPVDLTGAKADFAVGCTYKYLNGGPGAPGFIYVAPDLIDRVRPALCGWLGHESPFAFDLDYRPVTGIERMRVGTPSIIAMAVLDAALEVWDQVEMADVRAKSLALSQRFMDFVDRHCPQISLASPRDPAMRGSQLSFRFPAGYAVVQALIAKGVIGDFRAPDLMRFGITPLFIGEAEIDAACQSLKEVLDREIWRQPQFQQQKFVT